MNHTIVGMIVFTCTFGGALLGMWLRKTVPEHHLDAESKDTVKVGIGLIATMTALVLGLITASAKSSFDDMEAAVKTTAVEVLALDRVLARYGSETGEIRKGLQHGSTRFGRRAHPSPPIWIRCAREQCRKLRDSRTQSAL
jgi:hypothetical protein